MLDTLDKILELLENKDFPQLGNLLKDMNPADVAELFEDLPREKMALVFRLLPKELAADAFAYMNPDEQTVLVEAFSDKELHDVVNELYVDDAADMIEEMPANLVKRILRHTDAETRVLINQILNYPKDSAGSIMTMEYVDLKRGMTVEEALVQVDLFLDGAQMNSLKTVTIIHGKGTGALRAGIHSHLKRHPGVAEFRLGRYGEGEDGVTIVTLK